jgi:hypothetical protein
MSDEELAARDVHVLLDEASGRPVVRPGRVAVKRAQTVNIRNETNYSIRLYIPRLNVNGQVISAGQPPFQPDLDQPPGHYRYAVYCEEVEDFAEGGSSPIIIIK